MTTVTVSVGGYLRELRTRRGMALDELSRTTRVASRYLQALESDAFGELPAPVFIRGFIRAYCQALGEPPEEALTYYDGRDGGAPLPLTRPVPPARASGGDTRARGTVVVSFVLLLVLGMALFTVALVIRPGDRAERSGIEVPPDLTPTPPSGAPAPAIPASGSGAASTPAGASPSTPAAPAPAAAPTVPAPARSVPPAPSPSPTASSAPEISTSAAVRAAAPTAPGPSLEGLAGSVSAPYRLIARTSDVTWIRVRTEDGRSSEETVPAGEMREWVSNRPFVVTVGNAGGVSLELNGRALPPLGPRGTVLPRLVLPPESR